jgi:hypothetical protein
MPQIVDPRPLVEARLSELAAQFEPRLDALRCDIGRACARDEKRRLKRQRSEMNRAYRRARKAATAMLHAPIAW